MSIKKSFYLGKITGIQYYHLTNSKILKKNNQQKWNIPSNFNRHQDIAITSIRIEHSFLAYPHSISKEPQPICNSCHTTLTINHIIVEECTQYFLTRTNLNMPPNRVEVLDENSIIFKYHKHYKKIATFITSIKCQTFF